MLHSLHNSSAALHSEREAKVVLPTICQQRPRSASLSLPSLISFHPPIGSPRPGANPAGFLPELRYLLHQPLLASFSCETSLLSWKRPVICLVVGHD